MSRTVYVTVRSWEPWLCELVRSPFAVGSLGVKSFLRYRSLFYSTSLHLLRGSLGVLRPDDKPSRDPLGRLGASWRLVAVLGRLTPMKQLRTPMKRIYLTPTETRLFIYLFIYLFIFICKLAQARGQDELTDRRQTMRTMLFSCPSSRAPLGT